jgi:hypothetical protein
MATITYLRPPTTAGLSLSKKQLKFIKKYEDVSDDRLTQTILDSWYRPIPPPLNKRHKVLISLLLLLVVGTIIGTVFGTPEMSAIYWLTTQWNHSIKHTWDNSVPTGFRHSFRDCGIGVMGGLWIVFVNRNRYKPLKPLSKLDKLEIKWHISNVKDDHPFTIQQFVGSVLRCYSTVCRVLVLDT